MLATISHSYHSLVSHSVHVPHAATMSLQASSLSARKKPTNTKNSKHSSADLAHLPSSPHSSLPAPQSLHGTVSVHSSRQFLEATSSPKHSQSTQHLRKSVQTTNDGARLLPPLAPLQPKKLPSHAWPPSFEHTPSAASQSVMYLPT